MLGIAIKPFERGKSPVLHSSKSRGLKKSHGTFDVDCRLSVGTSGGHPRNLLHLRNAVDMEHLGGFVDLAEPAFICSNARQIQSERAISGVNISALQSASRRA